MVRSVFTCLTRTNHKACFARGRHIQIENTVIINFITHFKGRRESSLRLRTILGTLANYYILLPLPFSSFCHCAVFLAYWKTLPTRSTKKWQTRKVGVRLFGLRHVDTSVCNLCSEISPCNVNYSCLHQIILLFKKPLTVIVIYLLRIKFLLQKILHKVEILTPE